MMSPFDLRGARLQVPPLAGISWTIQSVLRKPGNVGKGNPKPEDTAQALVSLRTPAGARSALRWEELELMLVKGEVVIVDMPIREGKTTARVKADVNRELALAEEGKES